MTIGERIKFYRQKFGMTQGELGQKLLVSRQTVSLWEKDQTVPTIDNLLRLRDIFNASIDEILGCENSERKSEDIPNEAYRLQFSESECSDLYKPFRNTFIRRIAVFCVLCAVLFIFLIGNEAPDVLNGFILGAFIVGIIINVKTYRIGKKKIKDGIDKIPKNTYEYLFFDDFFIIRIIREEEICESIKVYFNDIEKIHDTGKYFLLEIGSRTYIFRKENAADNSALKFYIKSNPQKLIDERKGTDSFKIISNVLFVLSLLSVFCLLFLLSWMSNENNLFVENMWISFFLTPIPIASIVFGFILKAKKRKYKKNIIVGIIMTVILCVYGSFTFVFSDLYDHGPEPVIQIEQLIGIDIPEYEQINTQDWTNGTQSVPRGYYIHYTSDVYFADGAMKDFESRIADDERWLSAVPTDLTGITSPFSDSGFYDYMLIYNADTDEYNTLPESSGTYTFINVCFRAEQEQMKIAEYELEYIK